METIKTMGELESLLEQAKEYAGNIQGNLMAEIPDFGFIKDDALGLIDVCDEIERIGG